MCCIIVILVLGGLRLLVLVVLIATVLSSGCLPQNLPENLGLIRIASQASHNSSLLLQSGRFVRPAMIGVV